MKTILVTFLIFFYTDIYSQVLNLATLIKKNDPSVFKVFAYDYSDNSISQGSGIFISTDGIAITNFHVLENADSAYIITFDNRKYLIKNIVDYDQKIDLIKFKISTVPLTNFKPVGLNTMIPSKGNEVFTISYPSGLNLEGGSTVSKGIISGIRNIDEINLIQTTANITHGSSGGGLFDIKGNLIGITSGTFANNFEDLHANLNKVIPSSYILKLKNKLNISLKILKYNFNAENLIFKATEEEQRGNYEISKNILLSYLMNNFNSPRAWMKLGNIYSKLNDQEMSRMHYNMAIEIDSTYFSAYYNYAISEAEKGYNEFARSLAEKGANYFINSQYYYVLGYIELNKKEYSFAELKLTKCVELINKESSNNKYKRTVLYELAYCKYKLLKLQESKIILEELINSYPNYGFPFILYGDILYDLNDSIHACEMYKKVLLFGNNKEKKHAQNRIQELCN